MGDTSRKLSLGKQGGVAVTGFIIGAILEVILFGGQVVLPTGVLTAFAFLLFYRYNYTDTKIHGLQDHRVHEKMFVYGFGGAAIAFTLALLLIPAVNLELSMMNTLIINTIAAGAIAIAYNENDNFKGPADYLIVGATALVSPILVGLLSFIAFLVYKIR